MKSSVKFLIIVFFGIILLSSMNFLRQDETRIGEKTYFYERIVDSQMDYDELSYSGRSFTYNLGPIYLLLFLSKLFSINFLLIILPIIFGIILLILSYLILKKLNINENEINLTLIFLIITPLFLYNFVSYNPLTIILPLVLLSFYLFISKNKISKILLPLLIFIMGFFDYKSIIFLLIAMIIYLIKLKQIKKIYPYLGISFLSLIITYLPNLVKYGFTSSIFNENYFKLFLSDLGSLTGISLFLIFFSIFGINYLWKTKNENFYFLIFFMLTFVLTLLNRGFIPYFIILLPYIASLGVNNLTKSRWESESIRRLTLLLLILGLIFSSYSTLVNIKDSQPNQNMFNALNFLNQYEQGTVFSHYKYGIFINRFANKKSFVDSNFDFVEDLNQRYQDTKFLFYTRNTDKVKEVLIKNNIKYILITDEMKEGLVWKNNEEGLLFVLENSREFKRIYSNGGIEIFSFQD